jgi:DNA polymerase IV (archaeal DinB-like DNA polymerase)
VATTKSIAKIASDYQKPDGLTIVYDDKLKNFLDTLEVERISGIGAKTQKILRKEMKIDTIGQLAKTDVQFLIDRFGRRTGTWMWQVSNGEYHDPVVPRGDHVSLSAETTLEIFSRNRFEMKNFLKELVDKLYERVTNNGYQFRTVGVKLVRTDFSIETRETSYSTYKSDRKSIESVIDGLLDRFALEKKSGIDDIITSTEKILPVRKIGLKVSNLTRQDNMNFRSKRKTLLDYID